VEAADFPQGAFWMLTRVLPGLGATREPPCHFKRVSAATCALPHVREHCDPRSLAQMWTKLGADGEKERLNAKGAARDTTGADDVTYRRE
jgi:hypothetical protein